MDLELKGQDRADQRQHVKQRLFTAQELKERGLEKVE